jgi:hypothetical protein
LMRPAQQVALMLTTVIPDLRTTRGCKKWLH